MSASSKNAIYFSKKTLVYKSDSIVQHVLNSGGRMVISETVIVTKSVKYAFTYILKMSVAHSVFKIF